MESCKLLTEPEWIPVPKSGVTLFTLGLVLAAGAAVIGILGTFSLSSDVCAPAAAYVASIRYAFVAAFMGTAVFLVPKIFSKKDIAGRDPFWYKAGGAIVLGAGLVAAYQTYQSHEKFKKCAPQGASFPTTLAVAAGALPLLGLALLYSSFQQFYGVPLLSPPKSLLAGQGKLTPEGLKKIAAKQYAECGLSPNEVDSAPALFAKFHDLKAKEASKQTSWWDMFRGNLPSVGPPAPGHLPNMVRMREELRSKYAAASPAPAR